MVFNSMEFLIFFPIVVFIYYMFPLKYRYIWLLVSSYCFYAYCSPKYIALLVYTTLITYFAGKTLGWANAKAQNKRKMLIKKSVLFMCVIANFIPLFVYKYLDFFLINLNKVVNVETSFLWGRELLLPIGISFYTFQSLSYIIDVYREELEDEKNFFKYALFVSFFPLILSGPIERATNMLKQINNPLRFNEQNVKSGLLSVAWGLFLKIVVADRIAVHISPMFTNYENYDGMVLLVAAILFAFQIYSDFEGYSQMARGTAQILGYRVKANFASPYMATSIHDFWRRWHISLTSWFRDYLYISLGGNRKGKCRKYINNMLVFLISGLWHGAGWKYIVWGGLNGFFLVVEDATRDIRKRLSQKLGVKANASVNCTISRILTFLMIDFCWVFFNVNSLKDALFFIKKIVSDFRVKYVFSEMFWDSFGTIENFAIMMISLLIVFLIDKAKDQGVDIKCKILNQQIIVRWGFYLALILIILFWGIYGEEYVQTQFIYFQF